MSNTESCGLRVCAIAIIAAMVLFPIALIVSRCANPPKAMDPLGIEFAEEVIDAISTLDDLESRLRTGETSTSLALSALMGHRWGLTAEHGIQLADAMFAEPDVFLDGRHQQSVHFLLLNANMAFAQSVWTRLLCSDQRPTAPASYFEIEPVVVDAVFARFPDAAKFTSVNDDGQTVVDAASLCNYLANLQ